MPWNVTAFIITFELRNVQYNRKRAHNFYAAPICLWLVQTCFQGDIAIVFILIIKVVCFLLLPYPHSHFISSKLEPYGSSAVYAFVLVDTVECFLFMQNLMAGCWWLFLMNTLYLDMSDYLLVLLAHQWHLFILLRISIAMATVLNGTGLEKKTEL